jgi:transposase
MIQITAQMRVLVAIEPVDGRKGIDSLARLCQEKLAEDPFSGCVFVFRSRSGTAIRLLTYDGQGYWLAQKCLSKGRFTGKRLVNRRRGKRRQHPLAWDQAWIAWSSGFQLCGSSSASRFTG